MALGTGAVCAALSAGLAPASAQGTASLVVTTTRDGGAGSLRAAILAANQRAGSTISFAIPRSDAGLRRGVWTILLRRSLPPLSAARITIDGTSQTRFGGNTNLTGPEIEIFGGDIQLQVLVPTPVPTPTAVSGPVPTPPPAPASPREASWPGGSLDQQSAPPPPPTPTPTATPVPSFEEARPNGLTVVAPFATIRGLAINGFGGDGIRLVPDPVGGRAPSVAGGNFGRIEGCTIGLEAHGLRAEPNAGTGIFAESVVGTTIGSPQAERNLIAGNSRSLLAANFGVTPAGAFVTVQNNWFGLDATGEVLVPQAVGSGGADVVVFAPMRFGGPRASERNVVARSTSLEGGGTVQNNVFGFSASGRSVLERGAELGVFSNNPAPRPMLLGGPTAQSRNYTASCRTFSSIPGGVVVQNNWLGWSPANLSTGNGLLASEGTQIGATPGDPAPTSKGNRLAGEVYLFDSRSGAVRGRVGAPVRGNVLMGDPQAVAPLVYSTDFGYRTIANDFRDADVGVNGLQNAPALGEARLGAAGLRLSLGLHSRPNAFYVLDFYAFNAAVRTWTPLASRPLRTGASGDATLLATLPSSPARQIACTATDVLTGATSPMSNLVTATAGSALPDPTLVLYVAPNFGAVGDSFTLHGRGLDRVRSIFFANASEGGGPPSASFTLVNSETIRAVVPQGARSGPLTLLLLDNRTLRVEGSFTIIEADDNDFFARARALSGPSGAVADTFGRSSEPGEPAHAGQTAERSVWFRWTAPRDGLAEWLLAPGNNEFFSGRLAAYAGSSLGSLRPLASRTDNVSSNFGNRQLSIQFAVQAGTTYFIATDANFRAAFTLAWRYATEIERQRIPKPSGPPPSIRLSSAPARELQVLASSRATSRESRSS